ncbi:MAG TPA: hypothetical protein VEK08_15015 [Planctomycetota bacterium]|nr:hypothetical protein [Planctomycetota bacterium]
MAESKRVSGRQVAPSGTSGRAPAATSTSGRMAPQNSGSGRMPASTSGRAPAAPAPVSRSKMTAASPAPRASGASARISRRDQGDGGGRPIKKKQRGGPELMIAGGVIALLGIVAAVIYVNKSKKINDVESGKREQQELFDNNMKLGFDYYMKAENSGLPYVLGREKDDIINDEQKLASRLFSQFQGDDKVYNVLFERRYKDKKAKEKTDQKFMFPDKNRIERVDRGTEMNKVRVTYGFAENKSIPLVWAEKIIPSEQGDQANLGGKITVLVKATEDNVLRAAKERKPDAPAK